MRATLATIADAGRRRRRARSSSATSPRSTSRGSSSGRCSAARSWSRARASRRASCGCGSRSSAPRCSSCRRSRSSRSTSTLPELAAYAWLVFTSANGVDAFFDRGLAPAGLDARALGRRAGRRDRPRHRARARRARHARRPRARAVRRRVAARGVPRPRHAPARGCCSPGPRSARDVLPEGLADARLRGRRARPCTAPSPPTPDADDLARVRAGDGRRDDVHVVVDGRRTSATCVGALPDPQPLVVSIGPVTSATARDRGLRVDAEAEPHTIDGLVAALLYRLASRTASGAGAKRRARSSLVGVTFPERRLRRLRRTPALRRLVAEAPARGRRPGRAAVREGRHRRARAGRVDARRRAAHAGEPAQGGARRSPTSASPRVILFGVPAAKDARGSRRRRARRRRAGRAAQPARRGRRRARADGRRLPRRVHRPRPLRHPHRRRRGRQRRDARALRDASRSRRPTPAPTSSRRPG